MTHEAESPVIVRLLPQRCGRPWLRAFGWERFGKYSCLCFGFIRPGWSLDGASIAFAALVKSWDTFGAWPEYFRRLFLRVRRRPSARWPEGMRGILKRQARRWRRELSATQADRDMQRGNSALLRLAFLAAIVCVLRAPTFGGVDRGGPRPDGRFGK
jgi:hypothetical protein